MMLAAMMENANIGAVPAMLIVLVFGFVFGQLKVLNRLSEDSAIYCYPGRNVLCQRSYGCHKPQNDYNN